jgi:hypothetical protein
VIRSLCVAALLLIGRAALAQRVPVVVRDAGPGPVGRYLDQLVRRPETMVVLADTVRIPKDSVISGPLVVIGRRADIAGTVRGDVVVVGGDLFIKPGARVDGQGVAIGGGAYPSVLAVVRDGLESHRDFTFDATRVGDGIELRYREDYVGARRSILALPAVYGLRLPTYDRSNGISIPVGPSLNVGAASIDLVATYRSQIGRVDPTAQARIFLGRKLLFEGFIGRETRTNDEWISGPISNSLSSLISGGDERNWYRADGVWGKVSRKFETTTMTSTYSLGGSFERSRAARPGPAATSGPWSLFDRTDSEKGMFRPNPQIPGGDITSVVGGAAYRWTAGNVKARLDADVEVPVATSDGASFVQTTLDGRVEFPTFGLQRYRLELHAVGTVSEAPGQRFAYLGGSGTLPTEDGLLGFGGDQLLFIESRYEVPVPSVQLPFVGFPTLTFRHILGGAGAEVLPDLTQIVGARLSVSYVRAQWLIDTGTRKTKFSAGVSFSR